MFRSRYDPRRRRKPGRRFRDGPLAPALEAIICFFLLAAFAYGAYGYARAGDCCRVATILVAGPDKLNDADVIAQSGVTNEDNILFLDPDEVGQRVQAMPAVKSCRVTRFFPDKVVFEVAEREAQATLMLGNRLFEVDDECNVLRELTSERGHVGPFITNVGDLGNVAPGQRLTDRALTRALAVWRAFGTTVMARDVTVSEISAAHENRICMYCDELDFEIRWGRDHFEKQAAKLDVFWLSQNKRVNCKDYVDLRFGNDVACK